jgi:hypothetical protein
MKSLDTVGDKEYSYILTLIIYEIFRHKSGTKAVKNESKSKPPLLVNVRFFSFPSGQRVQKAEIGHKKKRTTSFVPLFVPLFACRHFSYIFTVRNCDIRSGRGGLPNILIFCILSFVDDDVDVGCCVMLVNYFSKCLQVIRNTLHVNKIVNF